jgi:heterodisulfide reductase subunit A
VAVCPTKAITLQDITDKRIRPILSEFDSGMKGRKAIYKPFPQAVPNKPLIDKENCMYFNNDGACQVCKEVCEINAIDYDMKEETTEVNVGNIILATGFKTFDANRTQKEYGYGVYPNVLTSLELERFLNASGPTDGNLYQRSRDENGKFILSPEKKLPESIAFIHCVGSRNRNYNKYCSRVCCMYSLKLAHLVKERSPEAKVFEYYIDMRAYGKGYEEFYNRIKEEGINIIRGLATRIEEQDSKLVLHSENILESKLIEQPVDMVILSVGLEPRTDAPDIAEILGIPIDEYGWFSENRRNFNPVETIKPGIFIAGCCQGPKDIPDTVAQASAAASEVLQRISKGKTKLNERNIPLEKIEQELLRLSTTGYDMY